MDAVTPEDLSAALDAAVAELLDAAGVPEPPVDALAIAERHLGFAIVGERRRPPKGGRVVVVDPDGSAEANQWAAAKAIASHLLPDVVRRLGGDADAAAGATGLRTRLAGRLLTPAAWFAAD